MKSNIAERWATVAVGLNEGHHICVKMQEGETKADVVRRVEQSLWGPPAKVKGVDSTPWGKE